MSQRACRPPCANTRGGCFCRSTLIEIRQHLEAADRAWRSIDPNTRDALSQFHNEDASLGYCLRWGSQATNELLATANITPPTSAPASGLPDTQKLIKYLKIFLGSEVSKGAEDGLAYDCAKSMLDEVLAGTPGHLRNLPTLKQGVLDYVIEMGQWNEDDEDEESTPPPSRPKP